jgi:hypothetical protein
MQQRKTKPQTKQNQTKQNKKKKAWMDSLSIKKTTYYRKSEMQHKH